MTTDIRLLKLWEQWKDALAYELEATSQEIADKRHAVTDEIEWQIEAERAEGPMGLVIQMGLAQWGAMPDAKDPILYTALASLTGLDVKAEADALFTEREPQSKVISLGDRRKD
jgi:hypothetical protein